MLSLKVKLFEISLGTLRLLENAAAGGGGGGLQSQKERKDELLNHGSDFTVALVRDATLPALSGIRAFLISKENFQAVFPL